MDVQFRGESTVSLNELLDAVRQLDPSAFQNFVADVLDLRAARQAPRISPAEAEILLRINAGLPENVRHRYQELCDKRKCEALTADEHAELLRLTDEVEKRQVERLAVLAEVAQLRGASLAGIMSQLGIRAPVLS
jgi:hypothetical protein